MQIALINESFPPVIDGVANVVMNYGRVLAEDGSDEVSLAVPAYPDGVYTGYPYTVVPYQSAATEKLSGGYRTGNPFDRQALLRMTEFCPEIIHAHSPATALFMARILRASTDAPLIYTYHTKYDIDIARAVKSELLQKETIRALVENVSACDEVWAVSRGAGENLRSLGFSGDIRVVNNGVDFPKGRADDEAVRKVSASWDLPENVPVFLYVGRLMTYKGLPLILDALRLLKERGTDFRMIFVGDGEDRALLEKKAAVCGCPGRIIFTGAVRDREVLRAFNSRADLFLFPSTFDTNGLVVREAAACGLASVLIRDSCAAEGVADGRNGFLIEENAESLAAKLSALCERPESMREAGQRAMDELYLSWESAVAHARDLYMGVLEKKRQGAFAERRKVPGEYFFETAGEAVAASLDAFNYRHELLEGMLENAAGFYARLGSAEESVKESFRETEKRFRHAEENLRAAGRRAEEKLRSKFFD